MDGFGGNPELRAIAKSCASAFLISLILTPIIRDIFRAYNVVDRPGLRKVHAYPIPRLGGISLAAAYAIALAGLHGTASLRPVLPGAAVIFLIGILDDFFNLPARFKLVGQIIAACLVFWSGLRIPGPVWVSFPATVFWLVLAANAFNLIDGLDGLCAGLGFTAALALFFMGMMQGNRALEAATLPLAGALLAFLCYNFNRATVFLGDSGALLIGFLLGISGLLWTKQAGNRVSMVAPLLVVAVPVVDLSLSIIRRLMARRPIFSPDRAHVHHRLLDRGLKPAGVALVLYTWGTCGGIFAFLLGYPALNPWQWVVIAGFLAAVLVGVHQLGYSDYKWRHS